MSNFLDQYKSGLLEEDTIDPLASLFSKDEEEKAPSRLERGLSNISTGGEFLGRLGANDISGASDVLAERAAQQQLIQKNKTLGEMEIDAAWDREGGFFNSIANVVGEIGDSYKTDGIGGVVDDVSYILGGIVEQAPNMIPGMAGMGAGALAGSAAGPVGTFAGATAGETVGNAVVETAGIAEELANSQGVDLTDPVATEKFLQDNKWQILKASGIKSGTVALTDVLTMKAGRVIMRGPSEKIATKILNKEGIDVADKKAVDAYMRTDAFKEAFKADPLIKQATSKTKHFAKGIAELGLESGGEFTGEFVGSGLAQGKWDVKEAGLEALSSIGQSALTAGGQFAYQGIKKPAIKLTNQQKIRRAELAASALVKETGDEVVDATNHANETARILAGEIDEQAEKASNPANRDINFLEKKIAAKQDRLNNLKQEIVARQERALTGGKNTETSGLEKMIEKGQEEVNQLNEELAALQVGVPKEKVTKGESSAPEQTTVEPEGKQQPETTKPAEEQIKLNKSDTAAVFGDKVETTETPKEAAKEEQVSTAPRQVEEIKSRANAIVEEHKQALINGDKEAAKTKIKELNEINKQLRGLGLETVRPAQEKDLKQSRQEVKEYHPGNPMEQAREDAAYGDVEDIPEKPQPKVSEQAGVENAVKIRPKIERTNNSQEAKVIYDAIDALGQEPINNEDRIKWNVENKKLRKQLKDLDTTSTQVAAEENKVATGTDKKAPIPNTTPDISAIQEEIDALGPEPIDNEDRIEWNVQKKKLNRKLKAAQTAPVEEVVEAPKGESFVDHEKLKTKTYNIVGGTKGKKTTFNTPNKVEPKAEGRVVDIDGLNREVFVAKRKEGWMLFDKKTGLSIIKGKKTQKDAIEAGIHKIMSVDNFDDIVKKAEDTTLKEKGKLFSKAKEDPQTAELIPEDMEIELEAITDDGETTKVTMNAQEAYRRLLSQRKTLKKILDCVKS